MNRLSILAVLIGSSLCYQVHASAQPAPAEVGIEGGPEIAQADGQKPEGQEASAESKTEVTKTPEQKIADLEAEIKALRGELAKMTDAKKDFEALQSRVNLLEGENNTLSIRVKTLESGKDSLTTRVMTLEADNSITQETLDRLSKPGNDASGQQTTAKFVTAAVRFHNHEGRNLRMNVNGIWHTLKPGKNDILVAYGPVHIHRYTDAEPKMFLDWKSFQDGFIMEFDVGKKAEK